MRPGSSTAGDALSGAILRGQWPSWPSHSLRRAEDHKRDEAQVAHARDAGADPPQRPGAADVSAAQARSTARASAARSPSFSMTTSARARNAASAELVLPERDPFADDTPSVAHD